MRTQYFLNKGITIASEESLNYYLDQYKKIWNGSKWIDTDIKVYSIIEKKEILSILDIVNKFGFSYFGQTTKGFLILIRDVKIDKNLLNDMIDFIYLNNTEIVNTKTNLQYKTASGAKKYTKSLLK